MSVTKLAARRVEKVWGRRDLPETFGGAYRGPEPLGKVWLQHRRHREEALAPGTAWLVQGDAPIRVGADAQLLAVYPGGTGRDALLG